MSIIVVTFTSDEAEALIDLVDGNLPEWKHVQSARDHIALARDTWARTNPKAEAV